MNWLELPKGTYTIRNEKDKISNCQLELDCAYALYFFLSLSRFCSKLRKEASRLYSHDTFISHAPDGEWSKIAPLRILSFDIECAGRKGIFPEADKDPVIQIANMVTRQGTSISFSLLLRAIRFSRERGRAERRKTTGEAKPFIRNIFTLNTCSHIVGSDVHSFDNEADLLAAWRDFLEEVDPDVIIGYNISQFDLPYLIDRAKALKVVKFPYFGRIKSTLPFPFFIGLSDGLIKRWYNGTKQMLKRK